MRTDKALVTRKTIFAQQSETLFSLARLELNVLKIHSANSSADSRFSSGGLLINRHLMRTVQPGPGASR